MTNKKDPAPGKKAIRILVVEDDVDDLLLLRDAVAATPGLVIEHVGTISDAIERLAHGDSDLVLLDLQLPDSQGVDGVATIRDAAPSVPIIVMTAMDSAEIQVAAVQAGAQDFLPKASLTGAAVLRASRHAIERHRLRQALERTAEGLAQSRSNLQTVLATSADAIVIVDEDGVVLFTNKAAVKLFRRSKEMLEGEVFDIPLSAGDATDLELDGDQTANVRVVETQWDGEPALMATFRNITARVRVQAALEASRRRLEAIVDRLPEGVALLDGEGRLVMANALAQEMLRSITGIEVGEILTHLGKLDMNAIRSQTQDIGRVELLWPGPEDRFLHASAHPLDVNRPEAGTLVVLRDVTRELQIQRQARNQDRLAIIGQLSAGAAHDFNNHLQVITGHAELLAEDSGSLTETQRHHVDAILQQGRHASGVARQILDFGPRGSGGKSRRSKVDVAAVVTEAWRMLARLIPGNIQVSIDVAPGLDYSVMADPTQLHQIITNLAINARDAMPSGGTLRLNLDRLRRAADAVPPSPTLSGGPWAVLSVIDTGTGIDPDLLDRIFDPFVTSKDPAEGTGLGLSQVYGLVREHEGAVDVQSEVDRGTTFRVFLPIADPDPDFAPRTSSSRSLPIVPAPAEDTLDNIDEILPPTGGPSVVLVVEDDPDVREILATMLDYLGYSHVEANDGRHGLEVFEEHEAEIAMVLTDLTMPEMSGAELVAELQKRAPKIEVFLLTAHDLSRDFDRYSEMGAVGWIQKPINMDALARLLSASLARSRRRLAEES